MPSTRRGMSMLEVVVALAILGTAGAASLSVVAAALDAERVAATRDEEILDAEQVLLRYVLMDRRALTQRLGERAVGPFVVSVNRPSSQLFRIGVATGEGREDVLVTVVYRTAQ